MVNTIRGEIMNVSELDEQDIIDGSTIDYRTVWSWPQYMLIKNNGTYQNNVMFAGSVADESMRLVTLSIKIKKLWWKSSGCNYSLVVVKCFVQK